MPFVRLAPIMMQVCDALSEAHEAGIVHRDLKPENLLVSRARDGHDIVKVLDFGLAKLRDAEELNDVTARGALIGTPFYMSPEQIRGEELDARTRPLLARRAHVPHAHRRASRSRRRRRWRC